MRFRSLASALALISLLCVTTACWPGVAALATLGGGGGGGGGGSGSSLTDNEIQGTIIVGATDLGGFAADHEPNDSAGYAGTATGQRLILGRSSAHLFLHTLEQPAGQQRLRGTDLFGGMAPRTVPGAADGYQARYVARERSRVFLLEVAQDGAERVRVVTLGNGFTERTFAVPTADFTTRGIAVAGDLLWLMQTSPGSTWMTALDPDQGEFVASQQLVLEISSFAAGDAWLDGTPRFFASTRGGVLVELGTRRDGSVFEFNESVRPIALAGDFANAPLAYDGLHLYALDAKARRIVIDDPDHAKVVATLEIEDPAATVAIAAWYDFGIDGYRTDRDGVDPLRLTFETAEAASDARAMFALCVDRARALDGDDEAILWSTIQNGAARSLAGELTARVNRHGTGAVDLLVGAFVGGSEYQFLVDRGVGARGLKPIVTPSSATAHALVEHILQALVHEITPRRLLDIYLDLRMPRHYSREILMGHQSEPNATSLAAAPSRFRLAELESSVSGFSKASLKAGADWKPRAPSTFLGVAVPRAVRTEATREILSCLCETTGAFGIDWCEPHYIAEALSVPNDPQYSKQKWHYEQINLPLAWDVTMGSSSVVIGVVDTGIRRENIDLDAREVGGYDFIADPVNADDGDGRDSDPYDQTDPSADPSHGSHVGGTACAAGNNGFGGTGVMWNASLLPVRALGVDGGGSTLDIAEAIRFAAGLNNASGVKPVDAAHVINLSLGAQLHSNAMFNAVQAAVNAGSIVCAAAGNDGTNFGLRFPAADNNNIAVGATDILENKSDYSNTGPELDFVAPGGGDMITDEDGDGNPDLVFSTLGSPDGNPPGTFGYLAGTSMATPHVAGTIGLILSASPGFTQDEVLEILRDTAKDLGDSGFDNLHGNGLIDAAAAIDAASPILSISVENLDFGLNGNRLIVQTDNLGAGTLQVTDLQFTDLVGGSIAWISAEVLADGRTIAINADRAAVAPGVYLAQMTIHSNGGLAAVLVAIDNSGDPLPDVGEVIIELRDSTGAVLMREATTLADSYQYFLLGFKSGVLGLAAGVDVDDDEEICEPGEACGMYPTNQEPGDLLFDDLELLQIDLLLETL